MLALTLLLEKLELLLLLSITVLYNGFYKK